MRPIMIILIVVALAIAGVTAFLVSRFLSETEEASRQVETVVVNSETVDVLVASQDLPVGDIVRDDDLRWQAWPEDGINPDYITKSGDDGQSEINGFVGSAVKVGMVAGEPVIASKVFQRGDAGFLSGVLTPGMRAVTIAVNERSGAAGFILPGDKVDVLLVFDIASAESASGESTERVVSETALEDVRVLAIDQIVSLGTGEEGANETLADVVETVTLEVTPNQAQALAVVGQLGQLSLSLRSKVEGEISEASLSYSPDFLVSKYLGRSLPDGPRVLVADKDLPVGTVLTGQDWRWQSLPADEIRYDWIVEGVGDDLRLQSALVTAVIKDGEPITGESLLMADQDGYVETLLGPGMRAITVPIDETRGVSGFVAPGSLVDIIYNYEITDESEEPIKDPRRFSEMLLENVRVLHIERSFNPLTGMPSVDAASASATLEVTPAQAERISVALSEGTLTLVLRGHDPGADTRLADYTSDFEASRSLVDLIYGLTIPPPPKSMANDSALIFDDVDVDGGSGHVRIYRSTVPQDLNFSGSGGIAP